MALEKGVWHKSTRSGAYGDNCVEATLTESGVAVRDSKNSSGPVLTFSGPDWSAFIEGAKKGEFDL